MEKVLMSTKVLKDGRHIVIYGDYVMENDIDLNGDGYTYPDFDVRAELYDEKTKSFQKYEPEGVNWYGVPYVVADMAWSAILRNIFGNKEIETSFTDPGIEEWVRKVKEDVVCGDIPKKVPGDMKCYILILVTEKFIFYEEDESFLMLSKETREIISDNYFAEEGLWQTAEEIKNGTDVILYKHEEFELPEVD